MKYAACRNPLRAPLGQLAFAGRESYAVLLGAVPSISPSGPKVAHASHRNQPKETRRGRDPIRPICR
jgi:hypothetical protein